MLPEIRQSPCFDGYLGTDSLLFGKLSVALRGEGNLYSRNTGALYLFIWGVGCFTYI